MIEVGRYTCGYHHGMPTWGATMRRRQLGEALRALRKAADASREHAAAVLDCAVSRIGHIENGRNAIRKLELDALMELYGADAEQHERLEVLRQEASQRRGWSSTYRLPAWLRTYVELEADAATMRSFEGELIPGLLQTDDYARRVHQAAGHLYGTEEIERFIAARKHRQRRLVDDEDPLTFSVVVSEAAFRRALGGSAVGPEQLAHVVKLAQQPTVTLHVLPFDGGLHASMAGSFHVLTFTEDLAPPFGYQEHAIGGHVIDDQDVVQRLVEVWELVRAQALSPDESLTWLRDLSRHTGE